MHLQLDGRGPLHAQLTRALKTALAGGRLGQGSRLPPTRALARDLGLSRNTVLTAYEQLRAEGFMDARVGSGSYVAAPLHDRSGERRAARRSHRRRPPTPAARATSDIHAGCCAASRAHRCATRSSTACRW